MNKLQNFFKSKQKIILVIAIALGLTLIFGRFVFWHDSILIKPNFVLNTKRLTRQLLEWPGDLLSKVAKKPEQPTISVPPEIANLPTTQPANPVDPSLLTNATFNQIGKGISTGIDSQTGNKYLKIEAGTVVEIQEYTLVDGRKIQVIKPIE